MPCQKILFDASLGDNMSEWYGTMTIKNMHYEDGTPLRVQEFLGMRFKAPPLCGAVTMQAQLKARQSMTPEITTTKMGKMGGGGEGVCVTARLRLDKGSCTLSPDDEITCGINGDMRDGAEEYLKSIEMCADEMPEGGEDEMKKQGGGM